MAGEKIGENLKDNSGETQDTDYPPFDPKKAKELVDQVKIMSSAEETSNEELSNRILEQQEKKKREEKLEKLADEAEARLGRDLSHAELQDLAKSYDVWQNSQKQETEQPMKNEEQKDENGAPEYDPTLYANESEWRAANSVDSKERRQQLEKYAMEHPLNNNSLTQSKESPRSVQSELAKPILEEAKSEESEPEGAEPNEITEVVEEGVDSQNNAEKENNLEMISLNEIMSVLGVLHSSELDVGQILMFSRGSRSATESSEILRMMFQNMTENSTAILNKLRNGRSLGEMQASQFAYENDMKKDIGYSMQALKRLKDRAMEIGNGGWLFQIQQVENNLLAINGIVSRRHNANNRDQNPIIPKEKMVTDEQELANSIDRTGFGL